MTTDQSEFHEEQGVKRHAVKQMRIPLSTELVSENG